MANEKRREEVNLVLDELEFSSEFPLIPRELVHCCCLAETSYSKKQYYRHEPGYWRNYMASNLPFWTALYLFQNPDKTEVSNEELSKAFSASYGIMQTMYDIAVDVHLHEIHGLPLETAINDFRKKGKLNAVWFEDLEKPSEINDDAIGLWYGCCELTEKMKTVYRTVILKYYDKGRTPIKLEDFMSGKDKPYVCSKPVALLDFLKMSVSAYQSGAGTVAKLAAMVKTDYVPLTWQNLEDRVGLIRNTEVTNQIKNHITRAFKGKTEEDFKKVAE